MKISALNARTPLLNRSADEIKDNSLMPLIES
jgi:hypothetical protein